MDQIRQLAEYALRLDNDVNGNPRYYLPCYCFVRDGVMYRPKGASKYRGKRYGRGWVFQSYNLEYDLKHALEE